MTLQPVQQTPTRRPVDWMSWIFWIILFILVGLCAFLIHQKSLAQSEVWLASADLSSYHLVVDNDFKKDSVLSSTTPKGALTVHTSPVGSYILRPIKNGEVLSQNDLLIPKELSLTQNSIPVSIAANAAMTLNGELSSGTTVDIWAMDTPKKNKLGKAKLILKKVLVLDVHKVQNLDDNGGNPYVIILAIPDGHQSEVVAASASGSLTLTVSP